jgi:hypothetical protein
MEMDRTSSGRSLLLGKVFVWLGASNAAFAVSAFVGKLWQRGNRAGFDEPWGTVIAILLLAFVLTWPLLGIAGLSYALSAGSSNRPPTKCAHCGYSLAGLRGGACPECGKSATELRPRHWASAMIVPCGVWTTLAGVLVMWLIGRLLAFIM